jgi:hypothetical protein
MEQSVSAMQESVSPVAATLVEGNKIRSEIIAEQVEELFKEETRCLRQKPTREPSYKFFKEIPSPVLLTPIKKVVSQDTVTSPSSLQKSRSEKFGNSSGKEGSDNMMSSPWAKRQVIVPARVRIQSLETGKSFVQIIREELYPKSCSPSKAIKEGSYPTEHIRQKSEHWLNRNASNRIFGDRLRPKRVVSHNDEVTPTTSSRPQDDEPGAMTANDDAPNSLAPVPLCKYKFYDRMRNFDFIVSVEYCNNCSSHNNLGHDEHQFEQNALFTLLYIAQQVGNECALELPPDSSRYRADKLS